MKAHAKASMILLCALFVTACVHQPPQTVVSRWAEYSIRVMNMVKASQDAVISLNQTGVINNEDTAKAMKGYREIGVLGQRLADSLTLYGYSPSEATAKIISDLVVAINNILLDVLGAISNTQGHEQLTQLFVEISKLAVTITGEVKKYGGR